MANKVIHIREPYWGAWKKYGWEKGVPGIGVKRGIVDKALASNALLYFKIGKDETIYQAKASRISEFCKSKKAFYIARFGTTLFVFPQYFLKKVLKSPDED